MSVLMAGIIGIVAIILVSYLAYTKFANPLASKYTVHLLFANANQLRPQSSLVRIAGVNVGKVDSVQPVSSCRTGGTISHQCQAANVTVEIDDQGLPLHKDATFAIRPRIFLEGNFFIDVHPGTPEAPTAPSGYTFPINAGTEPVQIDQVLGSLQADTRRNLQILLKEYGTAVKQGGPAYNASIQYWLPAYKYSSIVAHDALGIQPHDLSTWIAQMGPVAAALDAHPQELKSLITDFNTTAGAFARESNALQQSVAELPATLSAAIPAFNALNAAFPPLRAFARALTPGVISSGPTIDASLPFINQLRLLVQPSELQGLASDLSVTVPALAKLTVKTIPLMKNGVRPLASCVANVIYPWSQLTLNDGVFTGTPGLPARQVYVEGVDFLPGLAGESRNFDANGPYIRVLGTGGEFTYSLSPPGSSNPLVGAALSKIAGVQPGLPPLHSSGDGATTAVYRPPIEPKVPCETQPAISTLSTPVVAPPAQDKGSAKAANSKAQQAADKTVVAGAIQALIRIAKSEGITVKVGGVPAAQSPLAKLSVTGSTWQVQPTGSATTPSSTTTTPGSTTPTSSTPSGTSTSSTLTTTIPIKSAKR